ncbi:MAG: hypothetical protein FWD53_07270 [Phycisphaerales bacterium]|nr:hypothetical protein [Phycisphaerales bacterium]
MSQNPPPDNILSYYGSTSGELREIANRQRVIIWCILGYFIIVASMVALSVIDPQEPILLLAATLALMLAYLGVLVTALVFVFMLAIKLYGIVVGILLGLMMFVPLVNLITLLVISAKATSILKKNGVKVGFLGADTSKL